MPERKLAFFVEGGTELIFVRKLLEEIAGKHAIQFQEAYQRWDELFILEAEGEDDATYFALLVNCGQDEKVLSFILDRYEGLADSGFEHIIGLRDLHPLPRENLPELRKSLDAELATCAIAAEIFVAVMEIEAWFIEEWTHFQRMDPTLTMARVEDELNFNPSKEAAEDLDRPSQFLNHAYKLIGHSYTKKKWQAQATVDYLNFSAFYLELSERIPEIARLIQEIDRAVTMKHRPRHDRRYRTTTAETLWVVMRQFDDSGNLTHFGINESIERTIYEINREKFVRYLNYFHPLHSRIEFKEYLEKGLRAEIYFFSNESGIGGSDAERRKLIDIECSPFIFSDEATYGVDSF